MFESADKSFIIKIGCLTRRSFRPDRFPPLLSDAERDLFRLCTTFFPPSTECCEKRDISPLLLAETLGRFLPELSIVCELCFESLMPPLLEFTPRGEGFPRRLTAPREELRARMPSKAL